MEPDDLLVAERHIAGAVGALEQELARIRATRRRIERARRGYDAEDAQRIFAGLLAGRGRRRGG